jgi:hypothetical protein
MSVVEYVLVLVSLKSATTWGALVKSFLSVGRQKRVSIKLGGALPPESTLFPVSLTFSTL